MIMYIVLVILLDLSVAFDTNNHEILLNRLSTRCGIGGIAPKWSYSYLSNHTQTVTIESSHSASEPL